MSQFSSRSPDIDPYPWEHPNGGRIPRRYGREPFDIYAPRAEFVFAQTNEPNPILAQFRKQEDVRSVYALRQWVGFLVFWDGTICAATPEHIEHARRVLTPILKARAKLEKKS